jgi:hypothetical protein
MLESRTASRPQAFNMVGISKRHITLVCTIDLFTFVRTLALPIANPDARSQPYSPSGPVSDIQKHTLVA